MAKSTKAKAVRDVMTSKPVVLDATYPLTDAAQAMQVSDDGDPKSVLAGISAAPANA